MAILWQQEGWSWDYVRRFDLIRALYSAQYHRQHCTLQAFVQFETYFQNLLEAWYTVVIRYNTIGGVHKYESCYKPIVLYEMARFYLVLLDTIWLEIHGMR